MFFRQPATLDATLSHLFGCGSRNVAVAVGPVPGDEDGFPAEAAKRNVKIAHAIDTHFIDTHVHAGHVAGSVCGADISGKPGSTLGFEKRWDPMPSLDRAAFVDALTKEIPPPPAEMDRMVQVNLGQA